MYSLNHADLANTLAADRVRAASRSRPEHVEHRAPPVRRVLAWAVGRRAVA